jgi:hypothetical protein
MLVINFFINNKKNNKPTPIKKINKFFNNKFNKIKFYI